MKMKTKTVSLDSLRFNHSPDKPKYTEYQNLFSNCRKGTQYIYFASTNSIKHNIIDHKQREFWNKKLTLYHKKFLELKDHNSST